MFATLNFKAGDFVDANGQYGRIIDILQNERRAIICVRFAHNVGDLRPYDMIDITDSEMKGVDAWVVCDRTRMLLALAKRETLLRQDIEKELEEWRQQS